ncbi:MAG: error-prone DNA polymerase [Hyphomicrobiaceae bacterium]
MTSLHPSRHRSAPPVYAELQAVTNFSFLRGGSHPHELVAQAKALGLAALGVADHNTLAGVVRAHAAAREVGLRLVVGARLSFTDAPDVLCYPRDRAAYGRLSRLLSLGQGRAEKGGCILGLEDLATYAEGQVLIVLPPAGWSWRGDDAAPHDGFAADLARIAAQCGGAHIRLAASHTYRGDDRVRLAALARLAADTRIGLLATGDILYHASHRRPLQDVLVCIREGVTIAEAGLRLDANAERHLKGPQEMARLFRQYPEALAAGARILELCTFSLDELAYVYPDEPVPAGKTAQAHLEDLAREGARHHFPDGVPQAVTHTLERELALIDSLSYAHYFLTVHDIVAFARAQGILCQGRGSAANSVVCYCLGVTAVNPTEVDLLFERFVSPERKEPPDIDVDFEHERREEVIQYIYARYGRDRAGLAATVISYRARSAVREVGKAMGLSEDTVAALAGMVWGTRSGGALPETHVREAGLDPADPLLATVLALADELIGFPRHLSQHVGGFVLTRDPLVEIVPVGNAAMAGRTFIEWDKDDLAALGLLKVDVLALGMLTCIHGAFDLLGRHHGEHWTLASVPREDAAVYDMLCRADSIGVFQVESRAQMNMLPRLRPRTFYDLVIEVAIVRPGPIQGDMVHPYLRRRNGLEPEVYPAPSPAHGDKDELRRILGKTHGVPLFQEQAMRIAMVAARFTDGEVNELRKAMATFRRRGTIGLLEEKMISAMVARGYDPDFAGRCFNQIKGFGEYGFPESHAASFAHLVYVSSWLKCHYPAAFACALVNAQPMGFYAPAQIVRDAREHGVEVRPVDVNLSDWDCTLEDAPRGLGPALRLGLRQIDGLAAAEAEKLVRARDGALASCAHEAAGRMPARLPFRDVHDLWQRAGTRLDTLERLAAADAFRSMGLDRRQALWEVTALGDARPLPLFAWSGTRETGAEPTVALPAMPLSEHVVNDYQTLRLSLKAHPVSFLRAPLSAERVRDCASLRAARDGAWVAIAGVVLVRQRPGWAKGVVFMTIEDETGIANVVIWAKTLERYRRVVMTARLILIRGRVQRHEDIIHVVSNVLEDRSDMLATLVEGHGIPMPVSTAAVDEAPGPDPGQVRNRGSPRPVQPARAHHPRNERIIPPSRDFH